MPQSLDPSAAEIAQACALLRQVNCLSSASPQPETYPALRHALQLVIQASDQQLLGICADSLSQGQRALAAYAAILSHAPSLESDLEGPVYIKFNPMTGLCYANPYSGDHRGVLVSCQSADPEDVNEMFGHLPLDLLDESAG
ncbi:MAG: DUF1824 family protein [Elainella sp.]